jgi:hypothetical protein
MKNLVMLSLIGLFLNTALAKDVYVKGYTRSNGTYVQGHHRTTSDNTVNNNYSTSGNTNPYTGSNGTRPRDTDNQNNESYNYGD